MLPRLFTHKLLSPGDLAPSDPRMRVVGVFNPGVAEVDGRTVILARVVEQPVDEREGYFPSPRFDDGELRIDWLVCDDCDTADPRTLVSKTTGRVRLRFVSHLRLFWLDTPPDADAEPVVGGESARLMPQGAHEQYGIEDPRITRLGDWYFMTYVGVSEHGICTSLMRTEDFATFERYGVILPPDNKDVLLFPERVGGRYAMLHRPMPSMKFAPPRVWFAQSDDLMAWGGHRPVEGVSMGGAFRDRAGGSTVPILTECGWLVLVHGSDKRAGDGGAGVYSAGAVLLDRDEPWRVVARTPEPFMVPEQDFEKYGFVDNVVFPTGAVVRGGQLHVYYGAADEHVAVCGYDLDALLGLCEPTRSGR